uniref:Uncharacterized protein n=1 Tax=Lygus hesperus TaxID=30085 RepID=A0A0A9YGK4_LYGHE
MYSYIWLCRTLCAQCLNIFEYLSVPLGLVCATYPTDKNLNTVPTDCGIRIYSYVITPRVEERPSEYRETCNLPTFGAKSGGWKSANGGCLCAHPNLHLFPCVLRGRGFHIPKKCLR